MCEDYFAGIHYVTLEEKKLGEKGREREKSGAGVKIGKMYEGDQNAKFCVT